MAASTIRRNRLIGVYLIKHMPTSKIYVGGSLDVKSRWRQHICLLKKGSHKNRGLQSAWESSSREDFEFTMIEKTSADSLIDREQFWLDAFLAYDQEIGFNRHIKSNSPKGYKEIDPHKPMSPEHRSAIGRGKIGNKYGERSAPMPDAHRAKISASKKGVKTGHHKVARSAEHRAKLGEAKRAYYARKRAELA